MNGFDLGILAVVALSTLFAFARGVIREMIALATWITGFVLAIDFSGPLADVWSRLDVSPVAKHLLAFAMILLAVMVAGALVARMLSRVVRAIGLGFVDRLLGALFGLARGILVIVVFALAAGMTALPKRDWWQNSTLGRPLAEIAMSLKPYLPRAWAERLDFSAAATLSALLGEYYPCVES